MEAKERALELQNFIREMNEALEFEGTHSDIHYAVRAVFYRYSGVLDAVSKELGKE